MIHCTNCGHVNAEGASQCEACYEPLPALTSCPTCQASVPDDALFCPQCGASLTQGVAKHGHGDPTTPPQNPPAFDDLPPTNVVAQEALGLSPLPPTNVVHPASSSEIPPTDVVPPLPSGSDLPPTNVVNPTPSFSDLPPTNVVNPPPIASDLPPTNVVNPLPIASDLPPTNVVHPGDLPPIPETIPPQPPPQSPEVPSTPQGNDIETAPTMVVSPSADSGLVQPSSQLPPSPPEPPVVVPPTIPPQSPRAYAPPLIPDLSGVDEPLAPPAFDNLVENPPEPPPELTFSSEDHSEDHNEASQEEPRLMPELLPEEGSDVIADEAADQSTDEHLANEPDLDSAVPPAPILPTTVQPLPPSVGATVIQRPPARLIHIRSNQEVLLPSNLDIILIGKTTETLKPDIDVGGFVDSDVVSRRHAAIFVEADGYYLEDLGSSNGTYVNDEPCPQGNRTPIKPGDRISLGREDKVSFIFQIG